jgi:hypothetical protein
MLALAAMISAFMVGDVEGEIEMADRALETQRQFTHRVARQSLGL